MGLNGSYDVIVVGAGSSGCALAARLSEDRARRVLLVEAGPRFVGIQAYPPELRYSGMFGAGVPGHPNNWNFDANLREGVRQPLPRGKVVGGSSAVNGTIFSRGLPEDFDGWGLEGWSYADVLPFFVKLERDMDFTGGHHGASGPIPVSRVKPADWTPVSAAFADACRDLGFAEDADVNALGSLGVGALPLNNVDGVRINCALAYLDPAADRPNLTVMPDTLVERVLIDGARATGIAARRGGERIALHAGEVVLSAGAIKSPHLLMLSGLGPGEMLASAGIRVLHEMPHVGRNFTDHCTVHLPMRVRGDERMNVDPAKRAMTEVALHYTAEGSGVHSDMMLMQNVVPINVAALQQASLFQKLRGLAKGVVQLSWAKLGDQLLRQWDLAITIILMQGESRGEISLASADPLAAPVLDYRYLGDAEDVRRLREAVRLAARIVASEPYRAIAAERSILGDAVLESDAALDEHLRLHCGTSIHMASSCRMGMSIDTSVVDRHCRVHGVAGLRVADTSIMPSVVRRCPNATAVMIGERAAALFD